ncbi:GGDEF domain-containing protein [Pseudorhodoferax sp.]|uniref:GGDEF domain-containing protein n=1 Tax=Pseudorhodoferax sp. TaxID=1993553 RepID=UPI002DD629B3|nr:GGDEF domain-containing protein [Pseudorhodoferax sp.]
MNIWNLHPGTLGLSTVLLAGAIAAMAFVTARSNLVAADAARSWGWTMVAAAAAFFFWFIGQGQDGRIALLLGNAVAVVFAMLLLRSTHLLVRRPLARLWLVAQFLIGGSGIVLVELFGVARGALVLAIALCFLLAGAGAIAAIARDHQTRRSGWGRALLLALAVWCVGVVGARLYELFFGAGADAVRPLASSAVQVWALFLASMMLVVMSLGMQAILADQQRRAVLESARRDGLTGVLTRAAFFDAAQPLAGLPAGHAVMMLDVDHFKRVNDQHGHRGGDAVLRHVAAQLVRQLRGVDIVGRYGGEEFCVLLPGCDAGEALRVAQRVCEESARHPVRLPGGASVAYTVSIGVVQAGPGCADLEGTIDRADQALYRAKALGRNRAQLFGEDGAAVPLSLPGRLVPTVAGP